MSIRILAALIALLQLVTAAAAEVPAAGPASSPVAEPESLAFRLPAPDGSLVTVNAGTSKATVVWFMSVGCPMARLYGPRMRRLAEEFTPQGVRFVAVNSNRQDSMEESQKFAEELRLPFAVVRDRGNVIADRFGATRTTEVFLLDADLNVRYQGRIDDQYEPGVSRPEPKRHDLRIAIDEVLAGAPVSVARTVPEGCLIGRVKRAETHAVADNDVTFCNQVMRVLQRHCLECHRRGEIAPFSMEEYEEVVGWIDTMMETIEQGRMPPWSADPQFGDFANARHMPEADRQVLRDWIAGGLKRGDPADLPPPEAYVKGWQLERSPDLVLAMRDRPFLVPAEGTVDYQYFVVDPEFTEDKWIAGAQIVPGNPAVVHHAIAFVRPPDGVPLRGIGWLTAYVPGQRLMPLPPGHARKVPAGSKIVFQMHYTTNGQQQQDISKVGLLFADPDDVTHALLTLIAIEQEFEIPPGAPNHKVRGSCHELPEQGRLLAIAPHMHYRGKSFRVTADGHGESRTLLNVPRYDFNWQHIYQLRQPLPLKGLDRLRFTATFDNSAANPFNPDPSRWVTWGDQTWEEMAVAFFEVSEPLQSRPARRKTVETAAAVDPQRDKKISEYIERVFEAMDANRDGSIEAAEPSIVVRHFSFDRFDLDGNSVVTREEVRRLAENLFRTER